MQKYPIVLFVGAALIIGFIAVGQIGAPRTRQSEHAVRETSATRLGNPAGPEVRVSVTSLPPLNAEKPAIEGEQPQQRRGAIVRSARPESQISPYQARIVRRSTSDGTDVKARPLDWRGFDDHHGKGKGAGKRKKAKGWKGKGKGKGHWKHR